MKYFKQPLQLTFLLVALFLTSLAGNAQNDAKIEGRIVLVSSSDNNLVVKLQAKAIHNTDPYKILRITSASFWFKYSDSVVALAEQPVAASNAALLDGDYFYPKLANPYYTEKVVTRETPSPTSKLCFPHFVWEGWVADANGIPVLNSNFEATPIDTAERINKWTDMVVVKFKVLKTGQVKLRWDLLALEPEVLDDLSLLYDLGQFDDLVTNVTYQPAALKLASVGEGTVADPYKVTVRSSSTSEPFAGTAGYYVYYRSSDATAAAGTDRLNATPFFWGNATIIDQAIPTVSKDTVQYNRRLTYLNTDASQSNDLWPALAAAAREALHVVFMPTAAGTTNGIKTYLETINAASFKNWDESVNHTVQVVNAYRLLGGPGGGAPGPLPVSLTDFSATLQKQQTVLNWATASEENNEVFEIERSANGRSFTKIGSVKGHGTTSAFHAYTATDSDPLPGISYYRLKQVDFDKTATYSKVVAINNTGKAKGLAIGMVYPNPAANAAFKVKLLTAAPQVTLQIMDITGKLLHSVEMKNTLEIPIDGKALGMKQGVYLLRLKAGDAMTIEKLIVE